MQKVVIELNVDVSIVLLSSVGLQGRVGIWKEMDGTKWHNQKFNQKRKWWLSTCAC